MYLFYINHIKKGVRNLTSTSCSKLPTLRVRQGRETAKLKAITRVVAETPAPTNGGFIIRLAITPQTSVANAIPYRIRKA